MTDFHIYFFGIYRIGKTRHGVVPLGFWIYKHDNNSFSFGISDCVHFYDIYDEVHTGLSLYLTFMGYSIVFGYADSEFSHKFSEQVDREFGISVED